MPQAKQDEDGQSAHTSAERTSRRTDHVDGTSLPPHPGTTGSKLVCLYLSVVDTATMDELNETLDMQRLRLSPMLATLEAEGLVERDGDTFRSLPRTAN